MRRHSAFPPRTTSRWLGGLTARWDLDYDGTFDTGWLPLGLPGEQTVSLADAEAGTRVSVKAEVRDSQGNLNGATMNVDLVGPTIEPRLAGKGCGCDAVGRSTSDVQSTRGSLAIPTVIGLALMSGLRRRRRAGEK